MEFSDEFRSNGRRLDSPGTSKKARDVCLLKLANKSVEKSGKTVRYNIIPDCNLEGGNVSSPSPMISSLALRYSPAGCPYSYSNKN